MANDKVDSVSLPIPLWLLDSSLCVFTQEDASFSG